MAYRVTNLLPRQDSLIQYEESASRLTVVIAQCSATRSLPLSSGSRRSLQAVPGTRRAVWQAAFKTGALLYLTSSRRGEFSVKAILRGCMPFFWFCARKELRPGLLYTTHALHRSCARRRTDHLDRGKKVAERVQIAVTSLSRETHRILSNGEPRLAALHLRRSANRTRR